MFVAISADLVLEHILHLGLPKEVEGFGSVEFRTVIDQPYHPFMTTASTNPYLTARDSAFTGGLDSVIRAISLSILMVTGFFIISSSIILAVQAFDYLVKFSLRIVNMW